jgi:UDP-glucose 4-epimerase
MILVTGGAGFIGSHLCRRLVLEGYDVISLDDYSTGLTENHVPGVTYRKGHTAEIAALIPECPDVIFHLGEYARVEASFADEEQVIHSNGTGTRAVRKYWADTKAKMVYAGSSTIFATQWTYSPYEGSKRSNACLILKEAREKSLHAAVTFFYNVYGPGERAGGTGTVIEIFRQQHLMGEPLTVVAPGTQRRNFTHVSDIVDGLMITMDHEGEFQIGAAESYSVLEVAQMFGDLIRFLPERPGNRMEAAMDTSRIRSLGWVQQHHLSDYIKETP